MADPVWALDKQKIPESLHPWISWVLHDEEKELCPFFQGEADKKICQWPGVLTLELEAKKGFFSQTWNLVYEGWIFLPGDEKNWPQQVKAGESPLAVVEHEGRPALYLKEGTYDLSGEFLWDKMPDSFDVPPEVGLIHFKINGQEVSLPNRDEGGRLWGASGGLAGVTPDSSAELLDIRVYRKVTDDVPLLVTTRIDLSISGKNREIVLGKALPPDLIPLSLTSALPVRLEPDGRLRLQARAGEWSITLTTRSPAGVTVLTLHDPQGIWAGEEVWVFEARPDLRLVEVEGVSTIDPRQTTLPGEWQGLPTYSLQAGAAFKLVQKRRGNEAPLPDDLTLSRTMWLDFDGKGMTLRDHINGVIRQSSRLEMNKPVELGRVSIDGEDQFITQTEGNDSQGVEIRQGNINIESDSRTLRKGSLPILGWNHDFERASIQFNLPPGWRLFATRGVDRAGTAWIAQWTLLDLFLVFMIAVSVFKLWGIRWGLVSLVTLVLIAQERGAPQWLWISVLIGVALCRYLPQGKIRSFFSVYHLGAWILLVAVSLPFIVQQVKIGLYPALDRRAAAKAFSPPPVVLRGEEKNVYEPEAPVPQSEVRDMLNSKIEALSNQQASSLSRKKQDLYQKDPNAMVQTGVGITTWSWNQANLEWNGPVKKDQTMKLFLISPPVNMILSLFRALLVFVLMALFLGDRFRQLKNKIPLKGTAPLILFGLIFILEPSYAHADFPTPEILQSLKERLLKPPACSPECASISRMQMETSPHLLRLRLEVNALADTAIPLPGSLKDWSPSLVMIDGESHAKVHRSSEGLLYLHLLPGFHQVLMEGALPSSGLVHLALPLKPYRVELLSETGWTVDGIGAGGLPQENLTLSRSSPSGSDRPGEVTANNLPPFVRVERTLLLGLTWEVENHVFRVSPMGTPVVLEVPLLNGESVTTPGIDVEDGKAKISLGPQISEMAWRSVLEIVPELPLKAPETLSSVEVWRVEASQVWHVDSTGIPPIHQGDASSIPEWRPWPGEKVVLQISRPAGVPGQTVTIDKTVFQATPGKRATDAELSFDLRSSLGGHYSLTLPQNGAVKRLTINGADQPVRMEQNKLVIPLTPGSQSIGVTWNDSQGIDSLFRFPLVDMGLPSVNAESHLNFLGDRWILFLGGPSLGPSVLFWPFLIVCLLVGFALSRLEFSPLKTWEWLLLGFGLTQISVTGALLLAGWFLALGYRSKKPFTGAWLFDLGQLGLILWTLLVLGILLEAIHGGLLGQPHMQIAGNDSTAWKLNWYQDRSLATLPQPWVFSVPLYVYHLLMLAWSLWIAFSLIRWIRFGWKAFGEGGVWRPLLAVRKKQT